MKFFIIVLVGISIGLLSNWVYVRIFELDRQVHVLEIKDGRIEYLERTIRFLKWELKFLQDDDLDPR